jgi:hypothetical protein
MRFALFRAGQGALAATLLFSISCEEHHLGEYPEVQRDRLAEAREAKTLEHADPAAVSPTPVNFFPEKKSP